MLDRTLAPAFQTIQHVSIPALQSHSLANGLPLHLVLAGEQPVVRIEFVFEAGAWYEPQPGLANLAVRMLNEGTSAYTSAQLADFFDQYGAFLEFSAGLDRATVTLYGLAKHLPVLLPRLRAMLEDSIFPEGELETLKTISLQTLKVNLEKTAYVANQHFRERLFGAAHPYGQRQTEARIQAIDQPHVREFYEATIRQRSCQIFMAGRVSDADLAVVDGVFGQMPLRGPGEAGTTHESPAPDRTPILVEKADSLQSTIRMGRLLFARAHADYFDFLVLNEILGGYFGSRLMRNIREDKGFTYGISSQVAQQSRAGYLVIGTDVKKTDTQQTLDEIRHEIERLQTDRVPADELETVKNFMTGEFAGSLNTPFDIADRHKVRILEKLPDDFHATYVERLRAVTAEAVRQAAQTYLNGADLQEVVVGGK